MLGFYVFAAAKALFAAKTIQLYNIIPICHLLRTAWGASYLFQPGTPLRHSKDKISVCFLSVKN